MDRLPSSTLRRLKQLPLQKNSVWEGDRLELGARVRDADTPGGRRADCIIWVDGIDQTVRTIEAIPASDGPESYVRALIKAIEAPMEMPQMPMLRFRPQKVVVRDRQLQFFLRGILKDLEIEVEYHTSLPLIDEMAPSLRQLIGMAEENLPDALYDCLEEKAEQIWVTAPWKELQDHQILAIKIPLFDLEPFYVSVMGNLGVEYGLLLYRSVQSLKAFRQSVLRHSGDMRLMQEAFLNQDCLFLNFERSGFDEGEPLNLIELLRGSAPVEADDEMEIDLGSINPLEGIRPELDKEEAIVMILALEAINRFFRKSRRQFRGEQFPACHSRFQIALPDDLAPDTVGSKAIAVEIESLPELSQELLAMSQPEKPASKRATSKRSSSKPSSSKPLAPLKSAVFPLSLLSQVPDITPAGMQRFKIQDELVPQNALTFIGRLEWEMYELMCTIPGKRSQAAPGKVSRKGEGFPVFIVQTTRPKAKVMGEQIAAAGGVTGLGFCPMSNADDQSSLEVGLVRLGDGILNVFNDYDLADANHQETKRRWAGYIKASQGRCGFILATGATGAAKGQLNLSTMVTLYETEMLTPESMLGGL